MKLLTAAQLDGLVDQADTFQLALLDAYEASGHGWADGVRWTEDGLPIRDDRLCVLCREPMACTTFGEVTKAGHAIRRALLALGVCEEVLLDADARHSPAPRT